MIGTIRPRGANKYQLVVSHGYDRTGKQTRFYRTVTVKDNKEAKKQLALFYAEIVGGGVKQSVNLSFNDFIDYWREGYGSKQLTHQTYDPSDYIISGNLIAARYPGVSIQAKDPPDSSTAQIHDPKNYLDSYF